MTIKRYSGQLTIEIMHGNDDAYHAVVRHGRIVLGRSRFDADRHGYGSKVYSKIAVRALKMAYAKDEAVGDLAAMDDDGEFRVTINKRTAGRKSSRNSGVSAPSIVTFAATLRRSPSRSAGKHGLRVIDPRTQAAVWVDTVNLGGESYARRVPLAVARLAERGGIIEVMTARGWSRRRVIKGRDGAHYLRTL